MIVGIDIETTGLDPTRDRILEIAMVVVSDDLEKIEELNGWAVSVDWVLLDSEQRALCERMHRPTDLLNDVRRNGYHLVDVEASIVAMIGHYRKPDEPVIAMGTCVHFDLAFLRHWMPALHALFHHRTLDAKTPQLLWPDHPWPAVEGTRHRAMSDVLHSLAILREARRFGPK